MTSLERLQAALAHKEPDRVPLDLGSIVSGITLNAHRNLCKFLGIQEKETLVDRVQYLVKPASVLLESFGIDTRYVYDEIPYSMWSRDREGTVWKDDWGVKRYFTGFYYDMISHPLSGITTSEELKKYVPPEPPLNFFKTVREKAKILKAKEKAVIVNCIGSCFEFAWYLRGFAQFMMDLALQPGLACSIMDVMLDFQLRQFEVLLQEAGDLIDVVLVGDDLATQNAPLISIEMYRKYVKPRQKKLYQFIKARTSAPLFYHSCGAITDFLEDLVEIGVDIINPVQVAARGMDPKWLKKNFGEVLSFWGGIDTQRILPFGTPEEVRKEVRRKIDELAPSGGYVLCAVHNIQADVPPQNIVAMYEEALSYGTYH